MFRVIFRAASALIAGILLSFTANAADGLIKMKSPYSVKETTDKVVSIASRKGLKLFSRFDHQKNAVGVNMKLRPTEVIFFGNPKVGTPLMQCAQTVAIDMPQKILVMEDSAGAVWVIYTDPQYIRQRHNIEGCQETIAKISGVLDSISLAAVK